MIILVTGGCGFIGSHCSEYYIKKGNRVVVLDNLSKKGSEYNLEYLKRYKNMHFRLADVRDYKTLLVLIKSERPDVVIHTAGQTAVTTSMRYPKEDFETNVIGTFNLLETIRKTEIDPKIIFCSTNKVYGKLPNKYATKEYTRTDISPHTPYGVSKNCADLYMREYANTYGLKTGVFRMSCIYGSRQFGTEDQGWVAHFIVSALKNKKINIYGDGNQRRDLLHVYDLVNLYDKFIKNKSKKSGMWNIGGGPQNTMSLLELIDFLKKELNREIQYEFFEERLNDQKVYISMIINAYFDFDWKPKISPKEGIKKLISWNKQNIDKL